ncbi:MAG: Fic family protein [Rhodothermaceae bacterium]|nr:Fic family protein [Rhodothermaceae bacterium]MYD18836.1 Fic family protein [Rhodothermaceae bacterium]MYJ56761.1 Fic family protein [Rhodothermaceae bacterium]
MHPHDARSRMGRDVVISSVGEERVKAYLPPPLPPDPRVNMEKLTAKLEKAHWVMGRLDGMTAILPDIPIFLNTYVRQEALLSSQIEGIRSSLSDLLLFEVDSAPGIPIDDVQEVSNYVAAMNHGLKRTAEGFPLNQRLMREIHEILLSDGRDSTKLPGEFRRSQNWIGGSRPGNALYVPPPPEHVVDLMGDLEKFIHTDYTEYPTLVKAGLMHAQFETIHPFLDGNGRLGRLLITLLLCTSGLLRHPILYLSLYFKTHRSHYYELLQRVRTHGDWDSWLEFFLDGVIHTSEHAIETAKKILGLFERDYEKIKQSGRLVASSLRVHKVLQKRPVLPALYAVRSAGISLPTVYNAVRHLQSIGIVKEVTGKRRNRVFAYDEYFRILSNTSDPVA